MTFCYLILEFPLLVFYILNWPALSKIDTSDPLKWWKKKLLFSQLAKLACIYLAIPSTSFLLKDFPMSRKYFNKKTK